MPADSCLNISCKSSCVERSKSEKGGLVRLIFGLAIKACHSVYENFYLNCEKTIQQWC